MMSGWIKANRKDGFTFKKEMEKEESVDVCGRWRNRGRGWAGSWYLAVSEYLRFSPAEESGRYLIVIASMERTEAVPVRKFLIYLVFLFSLFHSLSLAPL